MTSLTILEPKLHVLVKKKKKKRNTESCITIANRGEEEFKNGNEKNRNVKLIE